MSRALLTRVIRATERMAMLLDGLLLLARLSRQAMRMDPVDLSAMAHRVVAGLVEIEPDRQITVLIEPNLIPLGDEKMLTIALENLLRNAWKYTSKTCHASIRFERAVQLTQSFVVADNGAGFDSGHADRIFLPFERAHSLREFEGEGIGLATVQRIIARHGGTVWAEGTPTKGAAFFFTLPGDLPPLRLLVMPKVEETVEADELMLEPM